MPRLLTLAELAERWRLPPSSIERLAKRGEIPFLELRHEFLFLESAIEEWENEKELENTKTGGGYDARNDVQHQGEK
jgi:excisionase family DNA binding protein